MLFLNNHQPLITLPDRPNLRLTVLLNNGVNVTVPAPSSPAFTLPSGAFGAWAVGLPLPGAASTVSLLHATAQPLAAVEDGAGVPVVAFFAMDGVEVEMVRRAAVPRGGVPGCVRDVCVRAWRHCVLCVGACDRLWCARAAHARCACAV